MNNGTMANYGTTTMNNDQQWCYNDKQSTANGYRSSIASEGNSALNEKKPINQQQEKRGGGDDKRSSSSGNRNSSGSNGTAK